MIFTGVNYRSVPSAKSLSLDLNSITLTFSGDKYNGSLPSGLHFGFSGASTNISFSAKSGKIYDPENRVVFSYSENIPFSLSLSFDETHYEYFFNNSLYCSNGVKSDFDVQNFFFNVNGLTADVDYNIFSDPIDYSITFPNSFSGSYLTGYLTNNSLFDIKVFTGTIPYGDTGYFSTAQINNISIPSNDSGAIILTDLQDISGAGPYFTLSLNTNFGEVSKAFQIYKT